MSDHETDRRMIRLVITVLAVTTLAALIAVSGTIV